MRRLQLQTSPGEHSSKSNHENATSIDNRSLGGARRPQGRDRKAVPGLGATRLRPTRPAARGAVCDDMWHGKSEEVMGEMKLTKVIPARRKTLEASWCRKDFMEMSPKFREIRSRCSSPMDSCYWCGYRFVDGDLVALACAKDRDWETSDSSP